MSELKPCPFCGNEPEAVKSATGKILYIKCLYCLINKRIDSWNTRHYPAEVQQAIERMKPKKLINRLFSRGAERGLCPICLCECENEEWNEHPHCRRCGQRLDWSE